MRSDMLSLQLRTRFIQGLVENIQTYFQNETGVKYPAEVIDESLKIWLENRFDRILEEIGEIITSPHMAESQDFRRILEEQAGFAGVTETQGAFAAAAEPVADQAAGTVFNGNRPFSPQRLGAMIRYISDSGRDIYKTNLNKLLFYSDMTAYYLSGRGISGATYVNLPFGPVPDGVNDVLNELDTSGSITKSPVQGMGSNAEMIKPGEAGPDPEQVLTTEEIQTLDWVLSRYGDMSATEISEVSHKEKAYASTRPGEPIAYEYAKFFENLPPRS
ncbi:MAG: Panacea domain-containing protein [Pyrinomonadaceae bacterium]